jgi:uncharacterized protein
MASRSLAGSRARSHLSEVLEDLPVFPLPGVVLMPGAMLPLHVFEPRYQALVRHSLATDRVFGIATLQPGFEADYDGSPQLYPEIGVGLIVAHERLEDDRWNLLLEHIARAVILEELPSPHPFRLVRAGVRADDPDGASVAMAQLRALVLQLAAIRPAAREEAGRIVALPDAEMLDELARRVLEDPDDQRRYLGLDRYVERAGLLGSRLGAVLAPRGTPSAEA